MIINFLLEQVGVRDFYIDSPNDETMLMNHKILGN